MLDDGRMPDHGSLLTLLRIADGGSLAAAGRAAGTSGSAVGKALARLEAAFGIRLFHRSTRSLRPTIEGEIAIARVRRIVAETEALRDELADPRSVPHGRLRVGMPPAAAPFLAALASFAGGFPKVELDVEFSDRQADVVGERFDVVIRSGHPRDSRLKAATLGGFRMVLAAAPTYLRTHGRPNRTTELASHRCIQFRFPHDGRLGSWPLGDRDEVALPANVTSNDLEARVAFAVAGLGIALLPTFAINLHLREGRLLRILDPVEEVVPLTMLWPAGRHPPSRMRAFIDHMTRELCSLLDPAGPEPGGS